VEEQIYERFPSKTDEFLMDQFHRTAWERRPELVERLSDRRLRELGFRLIYFPQHRDDSRRLAQLIAP
jgi:exonuclease I